MKQLNSFISFKELNNDLKSLVVEARGRKSQNIDVDKIEGKDADKNGTGGKIGIDEPVDNSAANVNLDRSQMSKNERRLYMKFKHRDDFFIVGKAGWGKTSIIKSMAKQCGIPSENIITMYLDKCEASDLGGIPIAGKDENGKPKQIILPPVFAQKIAEHEDQNFLLFFDEMNQAAPDVMNALMPIILEHEIAGQKYGKRDNKGNVIKSNFFCGAAGNFESENAAVSELSGPLKSRLKPLIVWETDTPEAWAAAFKYLHKQWDDKLSKEYIDLLEQNATLFENPRELEHKLIDKYVWGSIEEGDVPEVEDWLDHLERLVKDDLTRSQEKALQIIAEKTFNIVKNGGKLEDASTSSSRGRRKGQDMIPQDVKDSLRNAITKGYMIQYEDKDGNPMDPSKPGGKNVKYGISRENIMLLSGNEFNAEQMERLINMFEEDGVKFRFEKNSEWKAAGYKDPEE